MQSTDSGNQTKPQSCRLSLVLASRIKQQIYSIDSELKSLRATDKTPSRTAPFMFLSQASMIILACVADHSEASAPSGFLLITTDE